jgi:hypothetical protein
MLQLSRIFFVRDEVWVESSTALARRVRNRKGRWRPAWWLPASRASVGAAGWSMQQEVIHADFERIQRGKGGLAAPCSRRRPSRHASELPPPESPRVGAAAARATARRSHVARATAHGSHPTPPRPPEPTVPNVAPPGPPTQEFITNKRMTEEEEIRREEKRKNKLSAIYKLY